ncbi:MAG: zinc-ribbon domain-containing protein [Microcella sp.]|uniref:zinc-ribbon domain-containing protein n=1 Tax=Microcella sp. TaxID=1913979 RepID=UPI00271BC602|nr:zinc-ribbon domain-containing protein [Microcella sp.]MDO8337220.1 zinc-ribbon domain-containing protein [Microcella sp.]
MLFIFGSTHRDRVLADVHFVCEHCGVAAPQQIIETATKLSLFFVPLVTLGRKHAVVCANCGAATVLTRDQAEHGLQWAERNRRMV